MSSRHTKQVDLFLEIENEGDLKIGSRLFNKGNDTGKKIEIVLDSYIIKNKLQDEKGLKIIIKSKKEGNFSSINISKDNIFLEVEKEVTKTKTKSKYTKEELDEEYKNKIIFPDFENIEGIEKNKYSYSKTGNILEKNNQKYFYENKSFPHAVIEYGENKYTYDLMGNLISVVDIETYQENLPDYEIVRNILNLKQNIFNLENEILKKSKKIEIEKKKYFEKKQEGYIKISNCITEQIQPLKLKSIGSGVKIKNSNLVLKNIST
jgi:hypothetical protein